MILLGVASGSCANSKPEFFEILALGCRFSIPKNYALNTRERSNFTFFDPRRVLGGRITIADYDGQLPEHKYQIVSQQTLGHVTLAEVRYTDDSIAVQPDDPIREFILIHNGIQRATFFGPAQDFAQAIAERCQLNPDR